MNTPMNLPYVGFSIEAALRQAWEVMKKRYPFLLAVIAVFTVANMGFGIVGLAIQLVVPPLFGGGEFGRQAAVFSALLWNLISTLFITGPLMCSSYYVGVAARRGEPISMPALFRGFYHFGPAIRVYLLLYVVWLAVLLAVSIPAITLIILTATNVLSRSVGVPLIVICAVPVVVYSFYLTVRTGLALVLAVDDDLPRQGAWATIKTSWRWTRERQWHLMLLFVIATAIMLATAACLVLPLFFLGLPYLIALVGVTYAQLGADQGVFPVKDRCAVCHYHLKGIRSGVCPECGTPEGTL